MFACNNTPNTPLTFSFVPHKRSNSHSGARKPLWHTHIKKKRIGFDICLSVYCPVLICMGPNITLTFNAVCWLICISIGKKKEKKTAPVKSQLSSRSHHNTAQALPTSLLDLPHNQQRSDKIWRESMRWRRTTGNSNGSRHQNSTTDAWRCPLETFNRHAKLWSSLK